MKPVRSLMFVVAAAALFSCNKGTSEPAAEQQLDTKYICGVGKEGYFIEPMTVTDEMKAAVAETRNGGTSYVIPVVFHVFGSNLSESQMSDVLEWINNDFNKIVNPGDTYTFEGINESRKEYTAGIDIEFALAKYDPDGNPTTGVINYPVAHAANVLGLGNWESGPEIAKISWDNYRYFNIYLTEDLYASNTYNYSGIAWYPNKGMSDSGVARIVYNFHYLPVVHDWGGADFTSVITHEIGHWLDLVHTFNDAGFDGCDPTLIDGAQYGDWVEDTPQHRYPVGGDGFNSTNCLGEIIDWGNFMNYGVYCNFTHGQVDRMKLALEHPTRRPLWQPENLAATLGR